MLARTRVARRRRDSTHCRGLAARRESARFRQRWRSGSAAVEGADRKAAQADSAADYGWQSAASLSTYVTTRAWQIKNHTMPMNERTLIMGILNVTPDSFSDGGRFLSLDDALAQAEMMIAEGADIIDVGGESTRPGGEPISVEEEIERVVPVIEALSRRFAATPVSVDTTKSEVARAALDAGAAIVNDVSALRFDFYVADAVARTGAGLVLMHSRGTPATMQRLPPVADIMDEVVSSLRASIHMAERRGVLSESIVIDPGIGFGKTQEQNLELLARLDELIAAFPA